MVTTGMKYLAALLASGDGKALAKHPVKKDLLKGDELLGYEFILDHFNKYGEIPSEGAFKKHTGITMLPDPKDSAAYYADEIRRRNLSEVLTKGMLEAKDHIKSGDPMKALASLDMVKAHATLELNADMVRDFRDAKTMIMQEYAATMKDEGGGLMLGWPAFDNMSSGLQGGDVVSFVGRPAQGKAQPLYSKVLTLSGFKPMGDIKIGEPLASVDGQPSVVTGVYPQGAKPVYRLTFSGERTVEACGEHLWEVSYRDWPTPRVLTTMQLAAMLGKTRYKNRLRLRVFPGDFGVPWASSVSPWLLGLLLGDGGVTTGTPMFSTADAEIVARVKEEIPSVLEVRHRANYDYAIAGDHGMANPLTRELKALNVYGKKSTEKSIPSFVFDCDRLSRLQVLQGLMDADGWVQKDGACYFGSSSEYLAKGVQDLVRSLGGQAKKYLNKLGAWRVSVKMPNPKEVFTLSRKVERCKETNTHSGKPSSIYLTLGSIEEQGITECQCISVSHPSKLYVTDDYLVTHNTFKTLYSAMYGWRAQKKNTLIVSMEMNHLTLFQRMAAMYTSLNLTNLKKGTLSSKSVEKLKAGLHKLETEDAALWVAHGNLTVGVDDLLSLVQYLKPDAVFIDGAYLLQGRDRRQNRFERVAENMRILKSELSTGMDLPLIASWQFNREAAKKAKKKKAEDTGDLEDIGFADEIGQLSSIVLGLYEAESVETMMRRRIEILKGRGGETGSFMINWNFYKMDFSQYYEKELSDLKFL